MALVLCLTLCNSALAEFPTKKITYPCGYGAGGSSDIQARLMQPYAEKYFGVPMVIESPDGAEALTGRLNKSVDFEVASLSEVLTKHEESSLCILASCINTNILSTVCEEQGIPVLGNCDVKVIQGVCEQKSADEAIKAETAGSQGPLHQRGLHR